MTSPKARFEQQANRQARDGGWLQAINLSGVPCAVVDRIARAAFVAGFDAGSDYRISADFVADSPQQHRAARRASCVADRVLRPCLGGIRRDGSH